MVAVVQVAVAVGVVTSFIAESAASKEALRSANLLKNLDLNSLIKAPYGSGKLALAKEILPNGSVVSFNDKESLENLLTSNIEHIIITDFLVSSKDAYLIELIKKSTSKIVFTSNDLTIEQPPYVGITIELLPLHKREEDIKKLTQVYLDEAKKIFGSNSDFTLNIKELNTYNNHELKRSIYLSYLSNNIGKKDIMYIMQKYFADKIGTGNDYRDLLPIFDESLIRAETKKFKSQLQVAKYMGLNRNTLRKKIEELGL